MNTVDEARQSTSQSDFDRALLDSVNVTRPQAPSDALFNQAFEASTLGAKARPPVSANSNSISSFHPNNGLRDWLESLRAGNRGADL